MAGEHYEVGDLPELSPWVEDDTYARLLDSVVLACCDVLVRDTSGLVLLGKRSRAPHADWWVIGGRMRRGESFEQAAMENLHRELGLMLPAGRFRYFASYSTTFDRRAQPPAEHGVHTVNALCEVMLTDEELEEITPNDEYTQVVWRTEAEILADDSLHPLLRQAVVDARC